MGYHEELAEIMSDLKNRLSPEKLLALIRTKLVEISVRQVDLQQRVDRNEDDLLEISLEQEESQQRLRSDHTDLFLSQEEHHQETIETLNWLGQLVAETQHETAAQIEGLSKKIDDLRRDNLYSFMNLLKLMAKNHGIASAQIEEIFEQTDMVKITQGVQTEQLLELTRFDRLIYLNQAVLISILSSLLALPKTNPPTAAEAG